MRKLFIVTCMLFAALALAPSNASAQGVPGGGTGGGSGGGSSSTPVGIWIAMGCVTDIILAAAVANSRDNRELTAAEAWWCGLPFWFATEEKKKPRRPRHARVH
jgi:hypothetical protein